MVRKRNDSSAFGALLKRVAENGDVLSVPMHELRDAYGAGRLGVTVRASISKELSAIGLGHVPIELPDSQSELVRLYKKGTSVAEIVDSVLTTTSRQDATLREMASGDSQRILQKIKALVCD